LDDTTVDVVEKETTIDPVETDTGGDAAALGNGNAFSAPGTVTRDGVSGSSLLGPDGTMELVEPTAGTP
jgi:hypothetical protein